MGRVVVAVAVVVGLGAVLPRSAEAKSPRVGLLPAMGYNTWNDVRCDKVSDSQKKTAFFLDAPPGRTGLAALGFTYVNIDDCWSEPDPDDNGCLVPKRDAFPHGMRAVADSLHLSGFKLGIYADRGYKTCAFFHGSRGHEVAHALQFAEWGVDYLKYDSCWSPNLRRQGALEDYARMRDALNATGREILYSLSGWSHWYAAHGESLAHSWRISADCDEWANIYVAIRTNEQLAQYAGPGGFNDPDMLVGSSGGTAKITPRQSRAQFAMWAIMTAPLLIGESLSSMSDWDLATYSNAEVIAVNQDPSAVQGVPVKSNCPEFRPYDNWWCSPWSMPADVFEVWCKMLRTVSFVGLLAALKVRSRRAAALAAVPWLYTLNLHYHRPTVDHCDQIWAKPLQGGGVALAFVNFASTDVDLTCDRRCLARAGAPANFTLRDASNQRDLRPHDGLKGVRLHGHGDAVLFILRPASSSSS